VLNYEHSEKYYADFGSNLILELSSQDLDIPLKIWKAKKSVWISGMISLLDRFE